MAWSFILWGAYHGFFLVVERWFLLKYLQRLPKLVTALLILLVVNIGWVLFRLKNIDQIGQVLYKMFSFETNQHSSWEPNSKFIVLVILAFLVSMSGLIKRWYNLTQNDIVFYTQNPYRMVLVTMASLVLFFVSASFIVSGNFNPFIYWRF